MNNNSLTMDAFLEKWSVQFNRLKEILKGQKPYHKINDPYVSDVYFYKPEQLDIEVKEWLRLQSTFTIEEDVKFFKPHWIPLMRDNVDYYIDISIETFPIIILDYFYSPPDKSWVQSIYHPSLEIFLSYPEDDFDLRLNFLKSASISARLSKINAMRDKNFDNNVLVFKDIPGYYDDMEEPKTANGVQIGISPKNRDKYLDLPNTL